mgnify:FL=1
MENGLAGDHMEAAPRAVEVDSRPETEPVQTQHLVMVESTVEDLHGTRQSATLTNAVSLAQILFILHEFGLVGASDEIKELISHKKNWLKDVKEVKITWFDYDVCYCNKRKGCMTSTLTQKSVDIINLDEYDRFMPMF